MTTRARFTQADITRTIKAVRAAGFESMRIAIPANGTIEVYIPAEAKTSSWNSWDDEL
jgi:hypothetical protein